jgi:cysteine sulfinate desulfinase/cysteine desulfurase-like protein
LSQEGSSERGGSPRPLPCVISSAIEHPAVLCYLHALAAQCRVKLCILPVSPGSGMVDPAAVEAALKEHGSSVALVTIMHSNNEIGTIQPIRAIAAKIREHNKRLDRLGLGLGIGVLGGLDADRAACPVLFHSDAAQSIAKVGLCLRFVMEWLNETSCHSIIRLFST